MDSYDVAVIGAGNGGLTAAVALAQEGLNVILFERHNVPGGCATSFKRGRFEFDASLHQLNGIGTPEKPGPLRMLLSELGVMDDLKVVFMDDVFRVVVEDKVDMTLTPDRAAATEILKSNFPHERENIDRFMDFLFDFYHENIGVLVMQDPDATREKYPLTFRYAFKSCCEILDMFFTDQTLKAALTPYWAYLGTPPHQLSFPYFAMVLASYIDTVPCHFEGGSQSLSNTLLNRFVELGGTVRFNCGIDKIKVSNGTVKGVVTADGEEIAVSRVVSNASKIRTYVDMMDEGDIPPQIIEDMKGLDLAISAISLYIGCDCEPEVLDIKASTNFVLNHSYLDDRLMTQAGDMDHFTDNFGLTCYNKIHPGFSPPGTCQISLITQMTFDFWRKVPPSSYNDMKYRCADRLIEAAEKTFPNLRGHIEELEIATPLTLMRYLGHPGGAFYGFMKQIKDSFYMFPENRTYIKGLYMSGAAVGAGGYFPTLNSGFITARELIGDYKK